MKNIFKNPAVYAIAAFCALFVSANIAIGPELVKNFVDYGVLIVSLLFLFRWLPNAWAAFKSGGIEKKFRLSLGLTLAAAGIAGQRIWIIISTQLGYPDWINSNTVSSFIGSWLLGSMLLCLSIDSPHDRLMPQLKWYYTSILIGFGVVIGFIVRGIFFP